MRTIAWAGLWLGLVWSLWAAPAAVAGNGRDIANAPWKKGEEINAELVWLGWTRADFFEAVFRTPDGTGVRILLDPDGKCRAAGTCRRITPEKAIERGQFTLDGDILNRYAFGSPMRITFRRLVGKSATEDGRPLYDITASAVRRERDERTPRETWVKPYQYLRGAIVCPEPEDADHVYLLTEEGKQYRLLPGWPAHWSDMTLFCRVEEPVALKGDFLPKYKEKDVLRIYNIPQQFVP